MTSIEGAVPRLLTSRQLEQQTGLPRWRILELVRTGGLPHLKIGRLYLFPADQVARWIEEQSNKTTRRAG
jgi:excisionase family DNA binding protein